MFGVLCHLQQSLMQTDKWNLSRPKQQKAILVTRKSFIYLSPSTPHPQQTISLISASLNFMSILHPSQYIDSPLLLTVSSLAHLNSLFISFPAVYTAATVIIAWNKPCYPPPMTHYFLCVTVGIESLNENVASRFTILQISLFLTNKSWL